METKDNELKYTVTAFMDLQGFSSHLEIGNYDLRTKIGSEAIIRLNTIEKYLAVLKKEKENASEFYPHNIGIRRINDSLVLSLDLPDIFLPSIGEAVRSGFTGKEFDKYFDISKYESEEDFVRAYKDVLNESITELILFIGLVSRLHCSINLEEASSSFPGIKTVVSTGYHLLFSTGGEVDFLSANFAFSNAYIAADHLRGAGFFMDNNILYLLSMDKYCLNILRRAQYLREMDVFDLFHEQSEPLLGKSMVREGGLFNVKLFRKDFWFREMDSRKINYLQIVPKLRPHLSGEKEYLGPKIFCKIYENIKNTPTKEELENGRSLGFFMKFYLEDDIRINYQLIETGKSPLLDEIQQKEMEKNMLYYFEEKK